MHVCMVVSMVYICIYKAKLLRENIDKVFIMQMNLVSFCLIFIQSPPTDGLLLYEAIRTLSGSLAHVCGGKCSFYLLYTRVRNRLISLSAPSLLLRVRSVNRWICERLGWIYCFLYYTNIHRQSTYSTYFVLILWKCIAHVTHLEIKILLFI